MKLLLACSLALAIVVSAQECPGARRCPVGYDMVAGGRCVKILEARSKLTADELIARAITECAADGAYPPIITSDQDNDMFNAIAKTVPVPPGLSPSKLILGMTCDQRSLRLKWADGTDVNGSYTKNDLSADFDCTQHLTLVSEPSNNDWYKVASDRTDYFFTLMCATLPQDLTDPCLDYDTMDITPAPTKGQCVKFFTESAFWRCADMACMRDGGNLASIRSKEENAYFRRMAVGANAINGIHIGFTESEQDDEVSWRWIDDNTKVDDGYKNYNPSIDFPIQSTPAANCGAMQTETTDGFWVNINCDTVIQPFVCRKDLITATPATCPTTVKQLENTEIIAPGFPHPTIPCEYTLVVAADQLVELTIDFFESNKCCDFMEIYEGASGGTAEQLLAILSGTDLPAADKTITTKTSNVMRVNWLPDGAVNVRGFRMKFKGVPRQ